MGGIVLVLVVLVLSTVPCLAIALRRRRRRIERKDQVLTEAVEAAEIDENKTSKYCEIFNPKKFIHAFIMPSSYTLNLSLSRKRARMLY